MSRSIAYVVVAYRNPVAEVVALCERLTKSLTDAGIEGGVYVVVNDDSKYDSIAGVTFTAGHGNVGFASGVQIGVTEASESYIICVNPDCVPDSTQLRLFLEATSDRNEIIVPQLLDGANQFDYRPFENWTFTPGRIYSAILCRKYLLKSRSEWLPRYAKISGAFVGMPRKVALALNSPFDPAFFLYAEDRDMTHRARKNKIPIRFLKNVAIGHAGGVSGRSVSEMVAVSKSDGSIRIAHRKYGRTGAVVYAMDEWLTDVVKTKLGKSVKWDARRLAASRWRATQFRDPGPLDESVLRELLSRQAAAKTGQMVGLEK